MGVDPTKPEENPLLCLDLEHGGPDTGGPLKAVSQLPEVSIACGSEWAETSR